MEKRLEDFFSQHFDRKNELPQAQQDELLNVIENEYQSWFLTTIIQETEEIMAIDPRLSIKDILQLAAERIVQNLAADAATIRLFDAETFRLTSFGSFGVSDYERLASITVQNSVAGLVVQEKRSIAVPSILKNPLYQDKDIVRAKGFHSLLAVPLILPMDRPSGDNLLGALQIYYKEEDRHFDKLEITHAEMLARRISFVLAKKKILDLEELNRRKETIVNKIFVKLSRREGIKLKDLFVLLVPEIEELLQVKSCSLFTVSDDQQFINLVAAYPQDTCYHDSDHSFTVKNHPYFQATINERKDCGDNQFERITESYILVKDPSSSKLLSEKFSEFAVDHHIHSILLVPLSVDGRVKHLMAFYATEQKQSFSNEEIELFTFFGKEIMKASKLEFFGDILHDIKNPAIAVAGFANRARKLLETDDLESVREKLKSYLEIMSAEASRLQDLTQAMSGEGREEVLDLARIVEQRFKIIKEVVRESKQDHVFLGRPELEEQIYVSCPRFSLERVLDNLFGNAVKAIPLEGGELYVRSYHHDGMACLEVENSGEIGYNQLRNIRRGSVKGRGLNIITRFVHANHGNIETAVEAGRTRFTVMLPLIELKREKKNRRELAK